MECDGDGRREGVFGVLQPFCRTGGRTGVPASTLAPIPDYEVSIQGTRIINHTVCTSLDQADYTVVDCCMLALNTCACACMVLNTVEPLLMDATRYGQIKGTN